MQGFGQKIIGVSPTPQPMKLKNTLQQMAYLSQQNGTPQRRRIGASTGASTLNTAEFAKNSPIQHANNNKMFFSNDFGDIPKPPNALLDFGKLRDATPLDLMKNNRRNNYNRTTLA